MEIGVSGCWSQTVKLPVTELAANYSTIAQYTLMTAGSGESVTVTAGSNAEAVIVNTYTRETPPTETRNTTTEPTPAVARATSPPISTAPSPERTPQQAPPPIESGQLLGVRRSDPEQVLGARRGKTGDRSHDSRLMTMMATGAAALLAILTGRRKKRNFDDD